MSLAIAIVGSIVAIFSIIILHELGHYIVAKVCGIKILRFSVGFGKPIWKRVSRSGTEYVLALFPLGGYVKMLGEGEEVTTPEDAHRAYNHKPLMVRMAVVASGPLMNFLIAIIAYWGVYWMGVVSIQPVVGDVIPHSIAARGGVQTGDQLIKVDNIQTENWQRVIMAIVMRMGDQSPMVLTIKPDGSETLKQRVLNLSQWKTDRRNPDFFNSLGFQPYEPQAPPVIGTIIPDSPASKAGLQEKDRIIAINHSPVSHWSDVVKKVQAEPGKEITLTIDQQGVISNRIVTVGSSKQQGKTLGYLGIVSTPPKWPEGLIHKSHYSFLTAWIPAVKLCWTFTSFNFRVLVKMINGKISIHTLGGPITVFQAAGKATQAGFQVYLGFIGFISLTLAFINLLPIPGLDGGHLFFQIIEGILQRPVSERMQMIGLSIGMIFLIFLMVQATINDLIRLFFSA